MKVAEIKYFFRYQKYNVGNYSTMDAAVRKQLIEFFKPHNRRLYDYLGTDFDWSNNDSTRTYKSSI